MDNKAKMVDRFVGKYSFLSNFHPCYFEYGGMSWTSSEHAYQAMKTVDLIVREKIRQLNTPGAAKRFGARVPLRPHWETIKVKVMHDVVSAKFNQSSHLKRLLLDTGDLYLEEGNDWGDKCWGAVNGQGRNMLGIILMQVRQEIALKEK